MNKIKVLYVDDEILNLKLFEINLGKKYDILTAENGLIGLDLIKQNTDLKVVVSDMKMPHMNGIEFITKANQILPYPRYYILTGFEISNEIQLALKEGQIKKYFKKPFSMKEIDKEIESENFADC